MNELKAAVGALLSQAHALSLDELFQRAYVLIEGHPEAWGALAGSYRVQAADSGWQCAFAISPSGMERLADSVPVDVTIRGAQADLLKLARGQLNPAKALLFGKIKVQGSMSQLSRFSQILP